MINLSYPDAELIGDAIDDYEPCAACGYDHSYEPEEAEAWHDENEWLENV